MKLNKFITGIQEHLIFRPGVKLKFDLHGQQPGVHADNIPVRARIATVKK